MSDEELGLDQQADAIDTGEVQKTLADALAPAGWYRSQPPMFLTYNDAEEVEGFDASDKPVKAPRRVWRVFGPFIQQPPKDASDGFESKHTRQGFPISPDRRNRPTTNGGGPDNASLLWAQAFNAFAVAYGRKPTKVTEVLGFLKDYTVAARIIQIGVPSESNPEPKGEPRNMVVALGPIKE